MLFGKTFWRLREHRHLTIWIRLGCLLFRISFHNLVKGLGHGLLSQIGSTWGNILVLVSPFCFSLLGYTDPLSSCIHYHVSHLNCPPWPAQMNNIYETLTVWATTLVFGPKSVLFSSEKPCVRFHHRQLCEFQPWCTVVWMEDPVSSCIKIREQGLKRVTILT